MTEENTATAAVMTSPSYNGDKVLPKRSGPKSLLPSTWLQRSVRLEYVNADGLASTTTATLLDWCGVGPIFNIGGAKTVVSWDRLALVELIED